MAFIACQVCGGKIRPKGTGRPPRYCSMRCKEKARRNRDRDRESVSRRTVDAPEAGEPVFASAEDGPVCRVCDQHAATVGPPGNPILCARCAAA